eukprot:gene4423-4676_t
MASAQLSHTHLSSTQRQLSKALGNWEPDAAPALTWGEEDEWTATLEVMPGTHEFKEWFDVSGRGGAGREEIDLVLGLLEGQDSDPHPEAQLVETAGGTTMVKLTTTYTAAFGEYLK